MTRKTPARSERAQAVTDHIYEALRAAGADTRAIYAATLKRVRELIEDTGDADMVERVCLALVEQDGRDFVSWRSLGWGSFQYVRDMLEVPDGGWAYALAGYTATQARYADAYDYWLRRWRDGQEAGDETVIYRAQMKLRALTETIRLEAEALDG